LTHSPERFILAAMNPRQRQKGSALDAALIGTTVGGVLTLVFSVIIPWLTGEFPSTGNAALGIGGLFLGVVGLTFTTIGRWRRS
jgi:hypothetical protein